MPRIYTLDDLWVSLTPEAMLEAAERNQQAFEIAFAALERAKERARRKSRDGEVH